MEFTSETISAILGGLTALLMAWLKFAQWRTAKKQTFDFNSLKKSVDELKEESSLVKRERKLKVNIHTAIEVVHIEKMKHLLKFSKIYKNLLGKWISEYEEFSIDAYFSQYRNSADIKLYIQSKTGILMASLECILLDVFPKAINKKTILDFAHGNVEGTIYTEMKSLERDLIRNGLADEEYVKLFEDSLGLLLDVTITLIQDWLEKGAKNVT